MKVLIIGSGGREHAIAWKISKSDRVKKIYAAPGNPGIGEIGECFEINTNDIKSLFKLAKHLCVDLVVVGPEQPLAEGISDLFRKEGIPIFGPGKIAAQLESSKVFSKSFMAQCNVPTAPFDICSTLKEAISAIEKRNGRCAVKADGLAAGKGVFVCKSLLDAKHAVNSIMIDRKFGNSGNTVVVEDLLQGEEASILAVSDGEYIHLLEPTQDHKAIFDGDAGPNTGGMGAYSPVPLINNAKLAKIKQLIVNPVIQGMQAMGHPFIGLLYAGIMMVNDEPQVLEFNVRFGDPETQPIMLRLETDLVDIIEKAITKKLKDLPSIEWSEKASLCVVLASEGYPGSYKTGEIITGLTSVDTSDDLMVFHAGTKIKNKSIITAGGRVLGVTGRGTTISEARNTVYTAISQISFNGCHYRKDIGWRAIAK
ncbi:phosphoribosylamine--glycine ligase [bacterium]|nr:phosphoribosylamine--glycine ligase [candidate division CSSED10-310 bacterium]